MIKYFIDGVPHYIADDKQVTPTEECAARKIFLSEYRKKAGLTQKQLAEKLGVAQGAVANWEAGDRKPNIVTLKKIAKILGCTADELLEPIKI